MKRRRFKDVAQQAVYDWFRDNAPDPKTVKARGATGNAYFVGRSFPHSKRPFAQRNSTAYAAWAAGIDNAGDADAI